MIHEKDKCYSLIKRTISRLVVFSIPMYIVFLLYCDEIVHGVLGSDWSSLSTMLRDLSYGGYAIFLVLPFYSIFWLAGKPKAELIVQVLTLGGLLLIAAAHITIRLGVREFVVFYSFTQVLVNCGLMWMLLRYFKSDDKHD